MDLALLYLVVGLIVYEWGRMHVDGQPALWLVVRAVVLWPVIVGLAIMQAIVHKMDR